MTAVVVGCSLTYHFERIRLESQPGESLHPQKGVTKQALCLMPGRSKFARQECSRFQPPSVKMVVVAVVTHLNEREFAHFDVGVTEQKVEVNPFSSVLMPLAGLLRLVTR